MNPCLLVDRHDRGQTKCKASVSSNYCKLLDVSATEKVVVRMYVQQVTEREEVKYEIPKRVGRLFCVLLQSGKEEYSWHSMSLL